MQVSFLGLGIMGAGMAGNILRKHPLTVWNRTAERCAPLVAAGARAAATPAEAVRGADVVISMLSDPAAVDAVLAAALDSLKPGAIVIDMSTVDPATAHRADAQVRARGGRFLDAPVSGSRQPAADGTLIIMAGGDPATLAEARPVLDCMGRVLHVGAVGQGMAMKLVLNGLGAHMMTGFAALLAFGARQGLAPRAMLEVIGAGAFSSPLYASKGPRMMARDFRPDFTLALMRKDQELVLATAAATGCKLPTLAAIKSVLDEAIASGFGEDDLSGVLQLFEKWDGVVVS